MYVWYVDQKDRCLCYECAEEMIPFEPIEVEEAVEDPFLSCYMCGDTFFGEFDDTNDL